MFQVHTDRQTYVKGTVTCSTFMILRKERPSNYQLLFVLHENSSVLKLALIFVQSPPEEATFLMRIKLLRTLLKCCIVVRDAECDGFMLLGEVPCGFEGSF